MEKIKLSNGQIYNIKTSGVMSTDTALTVTIVTDSDLVTVEKIISNKENMRKIELLSESDEVLRIYSDYVTLKSIEKRKNVVIETKIIEPTEEGGEPTEEIVTSDVIVFSLKKESDTDARITSLEETVDFLVMSALV